MSFVFVQINGSFNLSRERVSLSVDRKSCNQVINKEITEFDFSNFSALVDSYNAAMKDLITFEEKRKKLLLCGYNLWYPDVFAKFSNIISESYDLHSSIFKNNNETLFDIYKKSPNLNTEFFDLFGLIIKGKELLRIIDKSGN